MAKGLRSNNKKALRTVRRQKLAENPEWQATAEAKRQEVIARVLATAKPEAQEQSGAAGMEVEAPQEVTAAAAPAAKTKKEKKSDGQAKMVTSTGKIHLTKKKAMKLQKKKQQAGNDLWKQGSAMAFHNKRKKRSA